MEAAGRRSAIDQSNGEIHEAHQVVQSCEEGFPFSIQGEAFSSRQGTIDYFSYPNALSHKVEHISRNLRPLGCLSSVGDREPIFRLRVITSLTCSIKRPKCFHGQEIVVIPFTSGFLNVCKKNSLLRAIA